MADQPDKYYRLPGRRLSPFVARYSLWLGRDHLLCVSKRGYSESYRRYYYRDVQALIIQQTERGRTLNVAFACLAVFTAILLVSLSLPPVGIGGMMFAVAPLCVIFLALLAINILRGPTCVCHLRTAVHVEPLTSLGRVRAARTAVDLLRPLIERAQGGPLGLEELSTKTAEMAQAVRSEPAASTPAPVGRTSEQKVHYDGTAHKVLFSVLLVDVIHTCAHLLTNHIVVHVLSTALAVGWIGSVVVALIKQRGSDMPKTLQGLTWAALAYLVLFSFAFSTFYQIAAFPDANYAWDYITLSMRMSPWEHPVLLVIVVASGVCSLLLGVFGLMLLRDFRRAYRYVVPAVPDHAEPSAEQEE